MKKIFLLLISIFAFSLSGISQDKKSIDSTGEMMNEQIVLDINWLSWINCPSEINLKPTSSEFTLSLLQPLFGKTNKFSMATGLALSTQNVKLNAYVGNNAYDKPAFILFNDTISYKTNKLATVFLDLPVEFRLRTRNNIHRKNFKLSIGGKIGYLIKSYHKYTGDDYRFATSTTTKFKEYRIPYLNKLHYGIFAKIFYGKLGVNVNYTLSTIFEKKFTSEIVPISIGVSMIFI